jgi:hypothetical protein
MIEMPMNRGSICTEVKYIWCMRTCLVALLYEFLLNIFRMIAKANERVSRNVLVTFIVVVPILTMALIIMPSSEQDGGGKLEQVYFAERC